MVSASDGRNRIYADCADGGWGGETPFRRLMVSASDGRNRTYADCADGGWGGETPDPQTIDACSTRIVDSYTIVDWERPLIKSTYSVLLQA